jgi:FkbH-like protein
MTSLMSNQRVNTPHGTQTLDAWDQLCAIKSSGRLIDEYPSISELLEQMDQTQRLRAGHLLAKINPGELLERHPQLRAARVAITGNATVRQMVDPLTMELARHHVVLNHYVSDYGQYLFELERPDSPLHAFSPELILCLIDAHAIFDELATPWKVDDVEKALGALRERIFALIARHQDHKSCTLALNTIPLPRSFSHQLLDYASRMRMGAAWRDFNASLLRMGATSERLIVFDMDVNLTACGPLEEPRASAYAGIHFEEDVLALYARDVAHLLRCLRGNGKKCLVLDLDGTLWGGVLGDQGPSGISLGGLGEGSAYQRFQKVLQQIGAQGVLLAICSKNELQWVQAILREHSDMQLRESDFSAWRVNWQPKHENIAALAAELNLAVDSMVFIDDSRFECGLVSRMHPDVAVICVDGDPSWHAERLLADGWFNTARLTAEDYGRHQAYAEESRRKSFQKHYADLEDYLRNLDTEVDLSLATPDDAERIAQITLRTNQFNLMTQRMDISDVRRLIGDQDVIIWVIRSRDRFGEHGMVGVIMAHSESDTLHIDNMLLSCRVFSRGIETACLHEVIAYAKNHGKVAVTGQYRPSAKNTRVANLFADHGFVTTTPADGCQRYVHHLASLPQMADYITITSSIKNNSHA